MRFSAPIKAIMHGRARTGCFLADASKFTSPASPPFRPREDSDTTIIIDNDLAAAEVARHTESGIEILLAT